MSVIIDGTSGVTTPGVTNTAGQTIATTLIVSGVTTLTGGLNAALPVLSGGTGVTTSTGSGDNVLSISPTLVAPALGTPASGNLSNCTGYPVAAPNAGQCRAWVNFDSTTTPPTVKGGFNVASVTRNGTGDFTINFTTALPTANYAASFSAVAQNSGAAYNLLTVGIHGTTGAVTTKTTTAIRITATYYNAASTVVNPVEMNASFFA